MVLAQKLLLWPNMETEIFQRVAVLETKVEDLLKRQEADMEASHAILEKLNNLENKIGKYHSFVGGVTAVLSGIWAIVVFAKDWVLNHLK